MSKIKMPAGGGYRGGGRKPLESLRPRPKSDETRAGPRTSPGQFVGVLCLSNTGPRLDLVLHEISFGGKIVPASCELQQAISHNWELRFGCGIHRFTGQGSIVIRLRAVRAVIADVHHGLILPCDDTSCEYN